MLFPGAKGDILAACMSQSEKWWYLTELAGHLRATPSTLQRDLKVFVETEVLEQRRDGSRVYYRANSRNPIFGELRGLVEKTVGILPALKVLLEPFRERIVCAFVYGSVAKSTDHAESDIDLMIIGEIGLAELSTPLRQVEERLGREVNVSSFSTADFQARMASGDHFLTAVLGGEKKFVKGNEHDLEAIAGKPRRARTSNVKARTPKSA